MTLIFIVFIVITAIQLLYWMGIFSGLVFFESPENLSIPAKPNDAGVSVIVCAHNQLHNLKKLVPALTSQDHPQFEVIIVNDRSSDGTEAWLHHQEVALPHLKSISVPGVPQGINPKKYALTRGVEAANHNLLLLTDADCQPESDRWISQMSFRFKENINLVLGYSGYLETTGLLNKLIRYETLLTGIQYLSRALDRHPYMGVGRNLAYRKSFFNRVGGLQDIMHITGGDDDLFVNRHATAQNTAVCVETGSKVLSQPKTTWTSYFKQKVRHLSVGKHYKNRDKWIIGIFSVSNIIFWSSLVSLLVTQTLVIWVAAGFLVRQLALSWVVGQSSRKLGEHIGILYVPLLDFLYSLCYLFTGLAALGTKKISWH